MSEPVAAPAADLTMQRSSRDASKVPDILAAWLQTVLPAGADPVVTLHSGIDANGMSSETLILDVDWTENGASHHGEYVARVIPAPEDVPVFETYSLQSQYDVMRVVAERSDVPVPTLRWMEPTGEVLGMPFFLMDRVDGFVPQDVLPYNFGDNWLYDGSPDDHRRLQDSTVRTIAALHAIPDAPETFAFLTPAEPGDSPLARNLAHVKSWYSFAKAEVGPSPIAERAFSWLEANLPEHEETVLCWGDSRIGNVIYQDFEPAAVLDWEMATLGPRELDVAWMLFAHQVFEAITGMLEMPGMPHFLREEDVLETYRESTGVSLGDLTWFYILHGVQWCVIFMRTGGRQIHFGEIEPPADIEELMHHKPLLERLLTDVGA